MITADIKKKGSPKVSICVVTYNQEKYIEQCLQSLVDQKTNFDFEIVVADDCSADNTREIVSAFAEKYPKIFRLFLHEKNIGAYSNLRFVHEQALGEYIAHMDGDDYALPGKLQAQADILDRDNNCNLVWTPVLIETAPNSVHEQNEYFKKNVLTKKFTRSDLIKYGTIGTNSSKMYRRNMAEELIVYPDFQIIDYFINVFHVGEGVACFTGEKPLGVYRMGIGIASNGSTTKRLTLQSIEYFFKIFKDYRLECSIAAGFRLLSDVRCLRSTVGISARVFLKTFHWRVIFALPKEINFMRSLTVEKK
ncbi:WcaA Glycosyltransferases involved in cell wall biogenesis [Burkholderiaceae bacterium]